MNNLKLAVDAYVRLHTLICENKGESEESDKIRDEMDVYYESLSEDDEEWLARLSANLYVLSSKAAAIHRMPGPLPPTISNEEMLRRAKERGGP